MISQPPGSAELLASVSSPSLTMYVYALLQKYAFLCHGIIQDSQNKEIIATVVAEAKSLQSCPTLCNPIDGSLPGSSIARILQALTPEWVAISFSNA